MDDFWINGVGNPMHPANEKPVYSEDYYNNLKVQDVRHIMSCIQQLRSDFSEMELINVPKEVADDFWSYIDHINEILE